LAGLSAPTHDLLPQDTREKKFTGRCRLYIGNLTSDVTEDEITQLFQPFGETAELFVNKEKNFAFIRLVSDYSLDAMYTSLLNVVKVYSLLNTSNEEKTGITV
jgi:proline- and glutamine-rich splicing factor